MTDATLTQFADSLAPPPYDKSAVSVRRNEVEKAVMMATDSGGFVESGSWSHGTSLAGRSDVDYMAIFGAAQQPTLPSTALGKMKAAIEGSHWGIHSLQISSPAVKVQFDSAPHFEVVPAYFKEKRGNAMVFQIPGPFNEWVDSVPIEHNAYVTSQNNRLNKRVKPLVRLIKAWKYCTGAPVSSFYLEMRTAKFASGESTIMYDFDLRSVLSNLIDGEMRQMNDPLGLVSRIPATSSDVNRRSALRMAIEAYDRLVAADDAKQAGDKTTYWSNMYDVLGPDYPWPSW